MAGQPSNHHEIRELTSSDEDFAQIFSLWHEIFPKWPIDKDHFAALLYRIPGHHLIHDSGFCLSYLKDGCRGQIAAIGVLPDHRGKGLGSTLLKNAENKIREACKATGSEEFKGFEVGSGIPRFWPGMPSSFPQASKDFFTHRGFRRSAEPGLRDLYRDVGGEIASPEILEKVSKANVRCAPWSAELVDECLVKQQAFSWARAYEFLATYGQYDQVMVAFDPETDAQIGWTLMCSPKAIISSAFAFMPLMPSSENTGLIAAVGVAESARGRGVGLALMVRAMENLKSRGVEGIFIDSVPVRGFYEQLGFETKWEYEAFTKE